mmetsp:Transcript_9400/g.19158  ORF Transcript_9400/g.19158 Transcript_9400/m.19158 type:complete len:94 (-) Transcript_9400:16-297(-)
MLRVTNYVSTNSRLTAAASVFNFPSLSVDFESTSTSIPRSNYVLTAGVKETLFRPFYRIVPAARCTGNVLATSFVLYSGTRKTQGSRVAEYFR